ncbi:MAG TPA: hypothetical protein VGE37_09240, partial [Archangium sp.]
EALAHNVLLHVRDTRLQDVVKQLVNGGLVVSRIQPERIPLEETFMAALKQSATPTGGVLE